MSRARVYYTVLDEMQAPVDLSVIQALPESVSKEILLYKKQGDINRLTAGKYLLKACIEELSFPASLLQDYSIDAMGKPFIPGFLSFNITHSGRVVACVCTEGKEKIGIDAEKIRDIEVTHFTKQFSPPEMMQILAAPDPGAKFFDYWTQKEAVMKADGRGMRIPLHSIRLKGDHATIDDTGTKFYLYPLELHETVKAHISSNTELEEVIIKHYTPMQLFGRP